jgi:aspartyl-tRNA(Asn)/glutamyl-tRNA(Gln) amidotransferase subunit B
MLSKKYEVVIGLEVHAELSTKTKIFCGCGTKFGAEPNSQVCPVCLGLPGVLPVLNKEVVEYAVRTALALNCRINLYSKFDRKNYYYPDLPKNYQISQNYFPIAADGYIEIFLNGEKERIRINNIHMEEDAGKNLHGEDTGLPDVSLVDFNRTGVPLLEIVTEPDMGSLQEVGKFMTALRDILLYIGVCDCRMEEGSLRFEANISLKLVGTHKLGRRVEMKNLNSFKIVMKALEHEIKRQEKLLMEGGEVTQETRLWDDKGGKTYPMRSKEEAHDYRYFPEPDLVPVIVDEGFMDRIRSSLPELPSAKLERFCRQYGLPPYDAEVLTSSRSLSGFYEGVINIFPDAKTVSNWVMGELLAILNEEGVDVEHCRISPGQFAELLEFLKEGKVNALSAKNVLREMFHSGEDARKIIEEKEVSQISDEESIKEIILKVISENPGPAADFRKGKKKALGYLVGQVMKATGGRANPKVTNRLLIEVLEDIGGEV